MWTGKKVKIETYKDQIKIDSVYISLDSYRGKSLTYCTEIRSYRTRSVLHYPDLHAE